jgi:cobalt/nickel transport system permease protein
MHMADALISPAVGGVMWAATAGTIAYCSSKLRKEIDDKKIPLMGVLGAFIFAAQMINFTIPATGSSGHLGGGMILAILLGPHAAFLTIASVLTVQALFFADGGLLALGCNIFNLGFFPAFIAYPLIYKRLAGDQASSVRIAVAAVISAVMGLEMGALGVVLETVFSGISSLPFSTFVALMLPIHLAIGIVEGLVTAAVISFVYKARPDILAGPLTSRSGTHFPVKNIALSFLFIALITGGVVSWFASENPDGLEWTISKVTGKEEVEGKTGGLHETLATLQKKVAFLPDYGFAAPEASAVHSPVGVPETAGEPVVEGSGKLGTSVAGLVGGLVTLLVAGIIGFLLKKLSPAQHPPV